LFSKIRAVDLIFNKALRDDFKLPRHFIFANTIIGFANPAWKKTIDKKSCSY